jgi:hypothetical protein
VHVHHVACLLLLLHRPGLTAPSSTTTCTLHYHTVAHTKKVLRGQKAASIIIIIIIVVVVLHTRLRIIIIAVVTVSSTSFLNHVGILPSSHVRTRSRLALSRFHSPAALSDAIHTSPNHIVPPPFVIYIVTARQACPFRPASTSTADFLFPSHITSPLHHHDHS